MDELKRPLADVEVTAGYIGQGRPTEMPEGTRTDVNGAYTLKVGIPSPLIEPCYTQVRFPKPAFIEASFDYVPLALLKPGVGFTVDHITMFNGESIKGKVLAADGTPVVGAVVRNSDPPIEPSLHARRRLAVSCSGCKTKGLNG